MANTTSRPPALLQKRSELMVCRAILELHEAGKGAIGDALKKTVLPVWLERFELPSSQRYRYRDEQEEKERAKRQIKAQEALEQWAKAFWLTNDRTSTGRPLEWALQFGSETLEYWRDPKPLAGRQDFFRGHAGPEPHPPRHDAKSFTLRVLAPRPYPGERLDVFKRRTRVSIESAVEKLLQSAGPPRPPRKKGEKPSGEFSAKRALAHYNWWVLNRCFRMLYREVADWEQAYAGREVGDDTVRKGVLRVDWELGIPATPNNSSPPSAGVAPFPCNPTAQLAILVRGYLASRR
jgi:hypothetical protein